MEMKILDVSYDAVIKSSFITATVNYEFAINYLVPLINRYDQQRYTLSSSFYARLEKDILNGCIMPALTIAINRKIELPKKNDLVEAGKLLFENIGEAFVLDGIQRLNTLNRIKLSNNSSLDLSRPLYLNIIISDSLDKLLYRMITLNNGQKPMSARHQVEILTSNMFDFENLPVNVITEKQQKSIKRISLSDSFKKEDVVKSYLAFITCSINIDNQKIIESKMDELISDQIMESNIPERELDFIDVMRWISDISNDDKLKKWFSNSNNLIGLSAAVAKNFCNIKSLTEDQMLHFTDNLENAILNLDVSKIKLGLARRKAVKFYFDNIEKYCDLSINQLTDLISQEV